jgi:RNA polymerase sigma-70 factor (family 1)
MQSGRDLLLTPNPSHNEKLLLSLIAQGDENAFRELYDQYFLRLSSYVFKLCKSTYITEDVLQEVFMKLWISRSVLSQVEVPEAFILSIAKNSTVDWLRKLSKRTTLIDDLKNQVQEYSNDTESKMSVESLQSLIASALSQLSREKQKVFHLSKYIGLSHDEIAHELRLSKSTVKNHLSETIKYIKKSIQPGIPLKAIILLALLSFI